LWEAVCANVAMATPRCGPRPAGTPRRARYLHRIARDPYRFGLGCVDLLDLEGWGFDSLAGSVGTLQRLMHNTMLPWCYPSEQAAMFLSISH